MKKQFRVLILCLTVLVLAAFGYYLMRNDDDILGFSIISSEQAQQKLLDKEPLNPLFCTIFFQGEPIPYDSETNTYYIYQPSGGKWEGRLTFGSYAYTAFWVSEQKESINLTDRHTLFISDGKRAVVCDVEICSIPLLYITLENYKIGGDAAPIAIGNDERKCSYRLFSYDEACGQTRAQSGTALIMWRGASSRLSPKRSYKLSLVDDKLRSDKRNFLGLRYDDDWILNPLNSDIDSTHEKVAYRIWSQIDEADSSFSAKTADCEYIEVCINSEYQGLYMLMTRLDAKQTALDKKNDILYKSVGVAFPSDEELESAGYAERIIDTRITYAPSIEPRAVWQPIRRYRDLFASDSRSARQYGWSDAMYIANLPSVIDFCILKMAIHATDNGIKNAYYLADGDLNGRITKIPWDLNFSFGDVYTMNNALQTVYDTKWAGRSLWQNDIEVLLRIDRARAAELIKQRWDLHSEAALSPANVRELMLSNFQRLWDSGAFRRDAARWPELVPDYTYEEWMERFDVILGAYEQKWRQIDDYVRELNAGQ